MMTTKYALLLTGILGVLAAIYGIAKGFDITQWLITLICGLSLLYGYFEFKSSEKKSD